MESSNERRRFKSLILDPHFQVRMWVQSSALALVGVGTLVFVYVYNNYLLFSEIHEITQGTIPLERYYDDFKISSVVLVALLAVVAVLNFIYSLKVSHRVIGPIYRIQTHLEQVLAGNKSHELRLREGDHFAELAELVNQVCDQKKDEKS